MKVKGREQEGKNKKETKKERKKERKKEKSFAKSFVSCKNGSGSPKMSL